MVERARIRSVSERPTTVAALAGVVRDAHDGRRALRIVGTGSWLLAGGTVRPDAARVETTALSGIIEYVPGDLTLTAYAGTTLAEIAAATAPHRQWCTLAPDGGDDVTLGAVFATATRGPFARAMGSPRDIALGIEFVDGTGAIARAGGRVVKNVAGFDLTRLFTGSWGTLGVITEVSVRIRAVPPILEHWSLAIDETDNAALQRRQQFERLCAPLAFETLSTRRRLALGLPDGHNYLVAIGGNASHVDAARHALQQLGIAVECGGNIWQRYRALGVGTVPPADRFTTRDALSLRIKAQFDPHGILNPGIFGELQ
jgi:glycolate oxidase FAD binding subunit